MVGYKVFNGDHTNRVGVEFKENSNYYIDTSIRNIKYGNSGYGYHFAKRLEDGLRFFDGLNSDISIAKVISNGNIIENFDDYYDYYDLFVTNHIYIDHFLTRKEIIDYITLVNPIRAERFVQGYKLKEEEIKLLLNTFKYQLFENFINYYQYGDKDAFTKIKKRRNSDGRY